MTEELVKRGPGRPRKYPAVAPVSKDAYQSTLDEVLSLDWRTQPRGKRYQLETRLRVAQHYSELLGRSLDTATDEFMYMPLTEETSAARREYHQTVLNKQAIDRAVRSLTFELRRRGIGD